MQPFRDLHVWERAHTHALDVRRATRLFPRRGYTSFKNQITDAAESIPFNIVEGCGAASRKEFARFLDVSIKSTCELEYQLQLARDYSVLSDHSWRSLSAETVEIRQMLCGLRRTVLEADRRRTED
jgi:four helix bundle protein